MLCLVTSSISRLQSKWSKITMWAYTTQHAARNMFDRTIGKIGLWLCVWVLLLSHCSPSLSPCDEICQHNMFLCFHQLRSCEEVCSLGAGETVTCESTPVEEGAKASIVSLINKDCGPCRSALAVWQKGQDCQEGQARCSKTITSTGLNGYLLQKCVAIQGRLTWSAGRLCDNQDSFPCVLVDDRMQCLGCGLDVDCAKGERCNRATNRCEQCVGASDCPGSLPYCSRERRCVACNEDRHCQPSFSGHYCVRGSCQCEQDRDCQSAGYATCSPATKLCVSCQSDSDCFANDLGQSKCTEGRCILSCRSDKDCSSLSNGICVGSRCLPGCVTDADCKALGLKFCSEKRCHQCLKHLDCSAETPFCHPRLRNCTECLTNEDCPPNLPVCDPSLFSCSNKQ